MKMRRHHWEPTLAEPQFYMVTSKSKSLVEIMMQCISGGSTPARIPLRLNTVSERDNRFHFCITIVRATHLESQSISLLRVSALQMSVETIFHSPSFQHSFPFLYRYLSGLVRAVSTKYQKKQVFFKKTEQHFKIWFKLSNS